MGILERVQERLQGYNRNERYARYNVVADGIYQNRRRIGTSLSPEFRPYIIAGLLGFDMRRTMGKGDPYGAHAFAGRLSKALTTAQSHLLRVPTANLATLDLAKYRSVIEQVYQCFANTDLGGSRQFPVGATKVLHWLFPDLFLMLDKNVAAAFREYSNVGFIRGTQPGYCAEKYLECLRKAQREIQHIGEKEFLALEPTTPMARIFDKIAFVAGVDLQ